MRILLIGSTGAIGREAAAQMTAAGHHVVGTTTRAPAAAGRGGHDTVQLDLLGPAAAVRAAVQQARADAIVHQATALKGLGNSLRRFDRTFATTNRLRTDGLDKLLDAARDAGHVRVVVQGFCGWLWARPGAGPRADDEPFDEPPKAFRQTLAALQRMEQSVARYGNGVVLRYGWLYGPGTSLAPGGPQIEAIRKRRFPVVGGGTGVWSFVHVSDAGAAAVAALDRGSGAYNIVDDRPAPISEWLPHVAEVLGARPPMRVPAWFARIAAGDGVVHVSTRINGASNARAKHDLGWRPAVPDWRDGFTAELAAGPGDRPGPPTAGRSARPSRTAG
jgi:nucleoside-diphosphate-sugar epimerase